MAAPGTGRWLEVGAWVGTLGHAAVGAAAVAWPSLRFVHLLVAGALFLGGTLAMLVAFGFAVVRSTHAAIGMGGLYFLAGTAPRTTARSFRLAFFVQVAAAIALAAAAPFTSVAFATLVPVWSLGFMGIWGGRYGRFDERRTTPATPAADNGARGSRVVDNNRKQPDSRQPESDTVEDG